MLYRIHRAVLAQCFVQINTTTNIIIDADDVSALTFVGCDELIRGGEVAANGDGIYLKHLAISGQKSSYSHMLYAILSPKVCPGWF